MNNDDVMKLFEEGLSKGIELALSQFLPMVPAQLRETASQYVADLVVRLVDSGGYEALKNAPLKEAPLMNLEKQLR